MVLCLVALVLLITATAKLISSMGSATILATQDPVTGMTFRDLFRLVAALEIAVAAICIFGRRITLVSGAVAWLATNFLIYRIALHLIGYRRPCSCMGNLTDALHLSPQKADTCMKIVLAYMLAGGYATLFRSWWLSRKTSLPEAPPEIAPAAS
jgi:hypothetical protein